MSESVTYHHHTILDVIECSIVGWQDKPPRLGKRPIPIDHVPEEPEPPRHTSPGYLRAELARAMQQHGPDGQWVSRHTLYAECYGCSERALGDALSAFVRSGEWERCTTGKQGKQVGYYRLNKGPAPARPPDATEAKVLAMMRHDSWLTSDAVTTRLGYSAVKDHGSAVARVLLHMTRRGLLERRPATNLWRKAETSNAYEYRLPPKWRGVAA